MRVSKRVRSAVVVAALAVGASTLVAAPASAAAPSGVTRDKVLTLAEGLREAIRTGTGRMVTPEFRASIVDELSRGCAVNTAGGETVPFVLAAPTGAGAQADGAVIRGRIDNVSTGASRTCVVGVVAASGARFTLRGGGTTTITTNKVVDGQTVLAGTYPVTMSLSGNVSMTAPFNVPAGETFRNMTFSAGGTAISTTKKVTDKKSKAEKRAAKKAYVKRIKAAKKSYKKALKRAGGSMTKQATARRSYVNKRASARAKYAYAIAGYKIVKRKNALKRPFAITADDL